MNKKELANIFEEIGILLELKGENPFKCRAYSNAAKVIENIKEEINELIETDKLKDIKGIGSGLNEKITELSKTGKLEYYEKLKNSIPPGLLDILKIPGLGPKKVRAVHEKLNIQSVGELEYACIENRLVVLDGFGRKSQEKILKGIEFIKKYQELHLFSSAIRAAEDIYEKLKVQNDVIRISIAGSLRRKKEVVKDMDFIASSENNKNVMNFFSTLEEVSSITAKGETKTSIELNNGINCDLRIVSDKEFPYALHHFTGSKEHNTIMRGRAKKMGIKMNEYGLFKDDKLITCRDEQEIFSRLKLDYIPPELREGLGEIDYAEKNKIPKLIEEKDIKGILHIHTTYSDGALTIEEMAEAVKSMGYSYIGISDHSKSAFYANGLSESKIIEQHKEIDELNDKIRDFKILKGIESDILPDGELDYSEDVLKSFDFVIASVHSVFGMSGEEMTERIIKAMRTGYVDILGHPTGRLLLSREAYNVDMKRIIDEASNNNVIIELNANPYRLDIDWREIRNAFGKDVKICINPDAHNLEGIGHIKYGIGIARKGWSIPGNVINTLAYEDIMKTFN